MRLTSMNLDGRRFGKWLVLVKDFTTIRPFWRCRCECGKEKSVWYSNLINGLSTSCGCSRHGSGTKNFSHGMSNSPTWITWRNMRRRCQNKLDRDYPSYGGRGIKVCSAWESFKTFLNDMGERPEGMTIERKNVNKDYTPKNCLWASRSAQSRNMRSNITVRHLGVVMCATDAARKVGKKPPTVLARLRKGMDVNQALSAPIGSLKNYSKLKGSECAASKLTESQVISMRKRRKDGSGLSSLAKSYKVSMATVSMICNRKTWTHI